MDDDFKTVTNAKGLEIPKYFKDFKKLVEKDRQLAEYLCMNYENLDSEDLGAFLETVEQGFSWILDLIEVKTCFIALRQGKNHEKRQQKKSLAESLATEASDKIKSIDIFSIP